MNLRFVSLLLFFIMLTNGLATGQYLRIPEGEVQLTELTNLFNKFGDVVSD